MKVVLAVVIAPVLLLMAIAALFSPSASGAVVCGAGESNLSPTQTQRAGEIIAVGREMKISEQGIVIALATGLAESELKNLANDGTGELNEAQRAAKIERSLQMPNDGVGRDHGSVGVFQQQVTMWGTLEELMNPRHSAKLFYQALAKVDQWQTRPLPEVAQAVQQSAFGDGSPYAAQEATARRVLGGAGGCGQQPLPSSKIDQVIQAMQSKTEATNPMQATIESFAVVGIALPPTVDQQRTWFIEGNATNVPVGQEQRGDIFLADDHEGIIHSPGIGLLGTEDGVVEVELANHEITIFRLFDNTIGAAATSLTGWQFPLQKGVYTVSSPFGSRPSPGGVGSTDHHGIDLAAPQYTPIKAAADGKITIAGPVSGYGNLIEIDHGGGLKTRYGHMHAGSIVVKVGQQVRAGQQIAGVGNAGVSTGDHLHLEIKQGGEATDPRPFFSKRGIKI